MDKLKNLRIKNNYSYREMGQFLNISKTYYWQLENDKRRLSYIMAIKIAKIFKTKPDKIFYEELYEKLKIKD